MSLGGHSNTNGQNFNSNNIFLPYVGHTQTSLPPTPNINCRVSTLPYELCQLDNPKSWNGHTNSIFMFGQTSFQEINVDNIKILLSHIANFISNRELKNNRKEDISFLKGFS